MISRQPLATLAELGVTAHQGEGWAVDDITAALPDQPSLDPLVSPAVRAASARLRQRVAACLPAGLHLVGDTVWGALDTDLTALAGQAVRWKEQAAFAELVAETGHWRPPTLAEAPQVRIEGRADRATPAGLRVSDLAEVADVEYWSVYGVGPDGLLDWAADFSCLADARHYAARWHRPGHLICADLTRPLATPATAAADPGSRILGAGQDPLTGAAVTPDSHTLTGAHR